MQSADPVLFSKDSLGRLKRKKLNPMYAPTPTNEEAEEVYNKITLMLNEHDDKNHQD